MTTPAARPEDANPLLAAALAYAARGWRVAPLHAVDVRGCSCSSPECKSPGKHPRTKHGLKDGTTDAEVIRRWWGQWPRANVAIVCGRESGLWVVGPDGEQGKREWRELCRANGGVDAVSALATTQGGGEHLLFAWPADGGPIPNRKNHRGTKIDVRAEGEGGCGYVVAAPSVGEKGVYGWEVPPPAGGLAPAPAWLVEWARGTDPKPAEAPPAARPAPPPGPDAADVHRRAVQYLNRLPDAVSGERGHDQTFWAARVLVWGFALPEHEAFALLATFYNPRCKPPWAEKDLRHKVREAGERPFNKEKGWLLRSADPSRDFPPPRVDPPAAERKPWEVAACGPRPAVGLTAAELVDKEFPPPRWAVEGLLPEGLTVLGGRPKQGKSWLSLLIATAVAAGHPLDGRAVPAGGRVVYLALEDTERRLKERLLTLRRGVTWPVPERLHLVTRWPRADDGGLAHLHEFLSGHPDTAFVIVDTLAKFRTPPKGNANGYADDYAAVGGLKELLDHHRCSGLLVHHTRKQKAEDPFDEMSGTQGIVGAADGMMVLDRARGSAEARLFVSGRDVADQTLALTWGAEHCRWTLGAATAGIEADGRAGGGEKPAGLIEACCVWLRQFLAEFAYPSTEVEAAAKAAGFAFPTLKSARERLSWRVGGPLYPKRIGTTWWNGLGTHDTWRFRPELRKIGTSEDRTPPRKDTGEGADPDDGF